MSELPMMRGDARMAVGATYFEVPLFSHVIDNLWQGCSPSEFPDVMEKHNYDPNSFSAWNDREVRSLLSNGKPATCKFLMDGDKPRFDKILNLYPWGTYEVPEGTEQVNVVAYDGSSVDYDTFQNAAKLVIDWLDEEFKVLVHCQAGLNRSSFVVALVLMDHYGMSADEAINHVRSSRSPMCLCNDNFRQYLKGLQ